MDANWIRSSERPQCKNVSYEKMFESCSIMCISQTEQICYWVYITKEIVTVLVISLCSWQYSIIVCVRFVGGGAAKNERGISMSLLVILLVAEKISDTRKYCYRPNNPASYRG